MVKILTLLLLPLIISNPDETRQGALNKTLLSMQDCMGQMNTEKNVNLESLIYKMFLFMSLEFTISTQVPPFVISYLQFLSANLDLKDM